MQERRNTIFRHWMAVVKVVPSVCLFHSKHWESKQVGQAWVRENISQQELPRSVWTGHEQSFITKPRYCPEQPDCKALSAFTSVQWVGWDAETTHVQPFLSCLFLVTALFTSSVVLRKDAHRFSFLSFFFSPKSQASNSGLTAFISLSDSSLSSSALSHPTEQRGDLCVGGCPVLPEAK